MKFIAIYAYAFINVPIYIHMNIYSISGIKSEFISYGPFPHTKAINNLSETVEGH